MKECHALDENGRPVIRLIADWPIRKEFTLDENGRPVVSPPSMAEYAMAKKEFEVGVDKGCESGDVAVLNILIRKKTLLDVLPEMYWSILPQKEKRKIDVK